MDIDEGELAEYAVRQVYTGPGQFVLCTEVSGLPCDRVMPVDADDCGIAEHLRVVPHGVPRSAPTSRSRRLARRPRLVVDEEFDVVDAPFGDDVSPGNVISTRIGDVDPDLVWVAISVQRDVTAFHGLTADEAIDNVRLVIRRAAETGSVWRTSGGFNRFAWRGYDVVVTPDLGTAVRYMTDHFERTPRQVDSGVKSRFRKGRRLHTERRPVPGHLRVGDVIEGLVANVVSFGVFVDIGECDALLHKSRLGDGVDDPRGRITVGAGLRVEILSIDLTLNRVELGLSEPPA